jgi:hypothetical protein
VARERVVLAVAVAVGLVALTWVGLAGLAALATRRAESAWAMVWLSLDDFEARFPRAETNANARRLEELAACVGIDFARHSEGEPKRQPARCAADVPDPTGKHAAVRSALAEDQREQLVRVEDRLDPPALEVAAWLEAQRANLAALRDHLRVSEPHWRCDLSLGYRAPVPNVLPVVYVHRVLLAAAAEAQRKGRPDDAAAFFDASLALDAAFADRPELISQLISAAAARLQAGLLRRLDPPPPGRAAVLAAHDRWRSYMTALEGVGRVHLRGDAGEASAPERERRIWGRFVEAFGAPWVRLSLAELSRRLAEAVGALAPRDACSEFPSVVTADAAELFPRWNVLARVAWLDLGDTSSRIARVRLDVEMSGHVAALREARRRDGRWPEVPGGIPSALCPGERWLLRALPDGRLEVSFSRDLPVGQKPLPELPLSCSLAPPAPAR